MRGSLPQGNICYIVGMGAIFLSFVSIVSAGEAPIASPGSDKPRFTAAQLEALEAFEEYGGIVIGLDEDRPGKPVVLIDFLAHPEFQERWLQHLLVFPELTTVRLGGTKVSDAGLDSLRRLPNLRELTLNHTRITDAGLAKLAELKRLRKLDLSGVQVSEEAIASLRKALPQLEVTTETQNAQPPVLAAPAPSSPAEPSSAVPPPPGEGKTVHFSAAEIKKWRERCQQIGSLPEGTPKGWSKSRTDPMKMLDVFPKLRIRRGYVLRAYVYNAEGNSNGFVWALPLDAEFPAPGDCPRLESHFLKPPKPFDALDDVMEVITGDDVPEAYLQASIFRREIREFGAGWHGVRWGMFTVLGGSPWDADASQEEDSPLSRPRSRPQQWKWFAPRPTSWAPEVRFERDRAIVTFYTYTPLVGHLDDGKIEKERIIQHVDTYRRGKFRPLVSEKKLAEGPDAITP